LHNRKKESERIANEAIAQQKKELVEKERIANEKREKEKKEEMRKEIVKNEIARVQPENTRENNTVRLTKCQLVVIPPHKDVLVKISTPQKSEYFASDQRIILLHFPDGKLNVDIRLCTNDKEEFNEQHEIGTYELRKDGIDLRPNEIDLGLTSITFAFSYEDKPVIGQVFVSHTNSKGEKIRRDHPTNVSGQASMSLPPGQAEVNVIPVDSSIPKGLFDKVITIESLPQSAKDLKFASPPPIIHTNVKSKVAFSSLSLKRLPTVLLGDISSSMKKGNRLALLRKALIKRVNICLKENIKVAVGAWSGDVLWFKKRWIKEKEAKEAHDWICNLTPSYKTDMAQAISNALNLFKEVKVIEVICDGDVNPFYLPGNRPVKSKDTPIPWHNFCKEHNTVTFSFVALDKKADGERLQKMAMIGRGDLTYTT